MEVILKELTYNFGATGEEDILRDYLRKSFSSIFEVEEDSLGNLYVQKEKKPKFVFLTGIDETTFFVSGKEKEFYKFKMLGEYKPYNLIDKLVIFKDGSRGIIRNPSEKHDPEINDLVLEVLGEKKPEIGETFIIEPYFFTYGDFFLSTNLDARAGAAILTKFLKEKEFKYSFKTIFLCQTKMKNKTFYFPAKEDGADFYFVITSFPCKNGIELGKGPVLNLFSKDYSLPLSERREILNLLENSGIPFQIGFEETSLSFPVYLKSYGLKKVVNFAVPVKYHNSVYKIAHKNDFLLLENLLENLLKKL